MSRLEEIKEHVKWTVENGLQPRVEDSDLEWLINRMEELEVWYHSYHKEAKLNNILKIQNKRYREALEEILKIQENHEWNLYGLAYGIAERILFDLEESE